MSNIIEIEDYKTKWASGIARCTECRHAVVCVAPLSADLAHLECDKCGKMNMVHDAFIAAGLSHD